MKVGLKLPVIGPLAVRDPILAVAKAGERLGYDSVWLPDHIIFPKELTSTYPYTPIGAPPVPTDVDLLEAIVALAFVAGCTERLRLGTAVSPALCRDPILLAKQLASLEALAGPERVVFGVGVGWMREEFEILRAPPYEQRGDALEEWIKILRLLWSEPGRGFDGQFRSFQPLYCKPIPRSQIEIWMGGHGSLALERTGRVADGWIGTRVGPADLPKMVETIRRSADRAGRDPESITISIGYDVLIESAGEEDPRFDFSGTSEHVLNDLLAIKKLGATHLQIRFSPAAGDTTEASMIDQMEVFAAEVIPGLASD